jgi:hypothetical protein
MGMRWPWQPKMVPRRRLNMDPRGGPLYVWVIQREDEGNTTGDGIRKGLMFVPSEKETE